MNRKKNLKQNLLICLLAGSAVMYTLPLHAATSIIANSTLPVGGNFAHGSGSIASSGLEMNVVQNGQNAVIKWDSFNVGGSATVNFSAAEAYANNFNTLNYVNSGAASQIYGTINAAGGNIFIVNPAGVQIGNSAQINVGSLYVSNNEMSNDDFTHFMNNADPNNIINYALQGQSTEAALMSLGNINAINVTFEGNGRIVIDSERIKDVGGNTVNNNFKVHTNDAGNVLIGYDAYNEIVYEDDNTTIAYDEGTYEGKQKTFDSNVYINGSDTATSVKGYMWVEDVDQLQAINTNLGGNYALKNSIDATGTINWDDGGFKSIGIDNDGDVVETTVGEETKKGFYGKFDGLDYGIFDLNINRSGEDNVGLFGYADRAAINNVTLVGGNISGSNNVGSVAGTAINTSINNVVNAASVNGTTDVGGIVGSAQNSTINNLINTGKVMGTQDNIGGNIGGLVGYIADSSLDGNSYNLGDISTTGYNVGGIAGYAVNSTLGGENDNNVLRNYMNISGAYNVGGIVGKMEGSTVQNAENSGDVVATGYTYDKYIYHSAAANALLKDYNSATGTGTTQSGSIENIGNGKYLVTLDVNAANAGGIAGNSSGGSTIQNVANSGDVSSVRDGNNAYYTAGNVGGVVGKAVDTNITDAVNHDNNVRGAHNVGGIAGYFGSTEDDGSYTISSSENLDGDIMATGARYDNDNTHYFAKEIIRPRGDGSNEEFIIGNIGGIAGYMDGDNVYISGSTNDGTVHTSDPTNPSAPQEYESAANVGGIVGKIDRSQTLTGNAIDVNTDNAAVNSSFNNGDVRGYTGVGGIAGMMYNGELAAVYNQGTIRSNRQVSGTNIDSLNMGGIVGDTTENSGASVYIYDAYNEGDIGDSAYAYFGRHVGGVVGRLSGTIEKAYNKGNIYNNDTTVGGIVGWWYNGNINNVFNTGNITARAITELQVGGLVGASSRQGGLKLSNAYNLGTIRGYQESTNSIYVGGIIGRARGGNSTSITNVYTTGNLYAARGTFNSNAADYGYTSVGADGGLGAIYGGNDVPILSGANYIMPETDNFVNLGNIGGQQGYTVIEYNDRDDGNNYDFSPSIEKPNITEGSVDEGNYIWRIYDGTTPILNAFLPYAEDYFEDKVLTDYGIGSIQYGTAYDPTLTIINAAEGTNQITFDWQELGIKNLAGLAVYGADLTINNFVIDRGNNHFYGRIYADGDLVVNANALGDTNSNNAISLGYRSQLYGSSVTLNSNGLIEIRGDVTATGKESGDVTAADNKNGSVYINGGEVQNYGVISSAAAGQNITISGISGKEQSVSDAPQAIANPYAEMVSTGERYAYTAEAGDNITGNINITAEANKNGSGSNGNASSYFGNKEAGYIAASGNLTVDADNGVYLDSDMFVDGDINLYTHADDGEIVFDLSNLGQVRKNAYVDAIEHALRESGLDINNVNQLSSNGDTAKEAILNAIVAGGAPNDTDAEKEANQNVAQRIYNLLTGKVSDEGQLEGSTNVGELEQEVAAAYMHRFLHNFDKGSGDKINFGKIITTEDGNADVTTANNIKLAVDMWNYETNQFDMGKFDTFTVEPGTDTPTESAHTFRDEITSLNFINGKDESLNARDITYIWVSDADQLQGIQGYYNQAKNETETVNGVEVNKGTEFLSYNFALKDDINANWVTGWEAIGTGNDDANGNIGFTGTFDGRGNRIIGLDATNGNDTQDIENAGIFSTIGSSGTVENLNIYSSTFTGTTNAGAVAGINNGTIANISALGNRVEVTGNGANASTAANAGGIVGVNNSGKVEAITENGEITYQITGGGINNVEVTGSVIAGSEVVAGGLIGTNNGGLLNSYSNSAVVGANNSDSRAGLGGVVGVNNANGTVGLVDSLGITNGGDELYLHVGGVIGYNLGKLSSAYNESIVSGRNQVGGIIGLNAAGGVVTDIVNAGSVTGWDFSNGERSYNVGGLIGTNGGSVTNGRNNGTITGTENVGGMVGTNQEGATLTNLVNDSSANITGEQYVGGIAGSNAGEISATDSNLINRGSITGNKFVGGVAGANSGTITNTISSIVLNVKDPKLTDDVVDNNNPSYFGGVVGQNSGTIIGATNQSTVDVAADGATYVGGIIGQNTSSGELQGQIRNEGTVSGLSNVGGIIGENLNASILNNEDNNVRLQITNTGNVSATEGGAAGIFYKNNITITGSEGETNANAINNADITNSGTVTGGTGADSITGGLFGINSGNITNSTLTNTGVVTGGGTVGGLIGTNTGNATGSTFTNEGIVAGNSNVGGLFGTNSGNFSTSSLINTADAQVIGVSNVGGLIGYNTGGIIGGRTEADGTDVGYYKYQIYNNGVITVGSWEDDNKDGKVDAGEIDAVQNGNQSKNIGGLIGENATGGSLTAGYNTGAINAGNSTNVGGIAGSNSGIIDQVFNTVMVANGSVDLNGNVQNAAITGGANVGGLAGTNSGTLSNAYNTTAVVGNSYVGNAVGENAGTIVNIYASNTTGNLIGANSNIAENAIQNAYSFVTGDNTATEVISGNDQKDSDSYAGFDFDITGATKADETADSDGTNDYWKIYAGSGNPLLKVFLTTVKVNADKLPDLVYNTQDQDLDIGNLTSTNGAFSAEDDFAAYKNNNSLIQNTGFEHKNAGTYDNWLYSGQIASSSTDESFNPNNLGYDIELTHDIDKAQITVDLNEVERTYGDTTILNNGNYGYSYDFANVIDETDLANLRNELDNNNALLFGDVKNDGGLVENGAKTNNAGDYNWTGKLNIADGYQGNYEFVLTNVQESDGQSSLDVNGTSITTIGGSKVNKRQLSISDIIANITYGNQDGKGFTVTSGGTLTGVGGKAGIVYDDEVNIDTTLNVTDANIVADSKYAQNKGDRDTADVDTYENSLNISGLGLNGTDANNYELVDDSVGGTIVVNKATITVDLNDVNRTYGSADIVSGGYGVINVANNTNGDNYAYNDFAVNVNQGEDNALTGLSGGMVTNDVNQYTYTGTVIGKNEKLNQNYEIVVNNSQNNNNTGTGSSVVNKADLVININDAETTYGTAFDESKYSYGFGSNGANVLVNGDTLYDVKDAIDSAAGGYNNTGAVNGNNGLKVTQDAEGNYSLSFKNELANNNADILQNYNIVQVNAGKATVNKKDITITAGDQNIVLGQRPNYANGSTVIEDVLVNGDQQKLPYYEHGISDTTLESVVGTHTDKIGVWLNGTFYDLSQNPEWHKINGLEFFANYNITFNPGTLTVSEFEVPQDWPHNRWDYLFGDNPFDRSKNFRERKAEVNFVDGGMEI